jgi:hypothetical protein
MGIRAQAVSMYGYGQATSQTGDKALRVETDILQVSAPSGLVSRGLTAAGAYYRLSDHGQTYVQARLVGSAPDRVLLPKSEVAQKPVESLAYMALQTPPTSGWTAGVQALASNPIGYSTDTDPVGIATRNFLNSLIRPVIRGIESAKAHQAVWVDMVNQMATDDDLLLSDLSYGFSDKGEPSFLLGLPGVQPLSSGAASTTDVWFDYLIHE